MIDAAHSNIRPCTGCIRCGYEGPCVQKDDVEGIRAKILAADMLVFVTPLYYFCAFNSSIQRKHIQSAMIAAAWNSDGWTFEALESHYRTLVRYLNLTDRGAVWGRGCGTPGMTRQSRYMQQAYELGRSLR